MLVRQDTYFTLIVILIIILLIVQGGFGDLGTNKINQTEEPINETIEPNKPNKPNKPNPLVRDFEEFGGLISPKHPYIGGFALIGIFYLFAIYLPNRWKLKDFY